MRRPWQEPSLENAPGFEEFVRERSDRLLAVARGLTASDPAAQDLVQDVLAKVLTKWDLIGRADDPGTHVNRMLVSTATSVWRRESRSGATAHDGLLGALATLRPKPRAVLVLRYYEGLNDHEIAATLNLPLATVRDHAARGLAALRKAGLMTTTPV